MSTDELSALVVIGFVITNVNLGIIGHIIIRELKRGSGDSTEGKV